MRKDIQLVLWDAVPLKNLNALLKCTYVNCLMSRLFKEVTKMFAFSTINQWKFKIEAETKILAILVSIVLLPVILPSMEIPNQKQESPPPWPLEVYHPWHNRHFTPGVTTRRYPLGTDTIHHVSLVGGTPLAKIPYTRCHYYGGTPQ